MKIINNVATLCMSFGHAVFSGALLFSAGSLTTIGWLVAVPLFIGSTAHVSLSVMNLIPEKKEGSVKADEKSGKKPQQATA